MTAARGLGHVRLLLERVAEDKALPAIARDLFASMAAEFYRLQRQIRELDSKLLAWHRNNEVSRRLAAIPGVGPIGAALLVMKTPAPELFASGRQFAAWIGLTPKDHSTGGKVRMGVITRAGDEMLRRTLVVGATSVLSNVRTGRSKDATPWLTELLKRKPPKLVAIAFANKVARIAWKIMTTGETYRKHAMQPAMNSAAWEIGQPLEQQITLPR